MGRIISAFRYALTAKPDLTFWKSSNYMDQVKFDVGSMTLPRREWSTIIMSVFGPFVTIVALGFLGLPAWISIPSIIALWFIGFRAFVRLAHQWADENYEIIIRKKDT